MIHYQLRCAAEHGFDGWFRSSGAFADQVQAGLVACPECGDTAVRLGLMAPAVPRKGRAARTRPGVVDQDGAPAPGGATPGPAGPGPAGPAMAGPGAADGKPPAKAASAMPDQLRSALQKLRAEVEKNCDHVGAGFADEARAIHRGETAPRAIYGDATPDQAEALAEEGIAVARIPWVPRADG